MLTFACARCERQAWLAVARLLAEWGKHAALADMLDEMRSGYFQQHPDGMHNVSHHCDARWSGLAALLGA